MHIFTMKTNIKHQTLSKCFSIFLVQNKLELLENNFSKEVRIPKYSTNKVILISTKKITKVDQHHHMK
jgi:hypothetical protein